MTPNSFVSVAVVVAVAFAAGGACKDDAPPPPKEAPPAAVPPPALSGLEVVPRDAAVVIGLDLAALRTSKPARAVVHAVLERDRELRAMASAWRKQCGKTVFDHLTSAVVAFGPGDADVLLTVDGAPEAERLFECMDRAGAVEPAEPADGRPVFRIRGASGPLWLSFGRPGTAVLARDRDWLARGLSRGVKVSENDRMLELLARVERDRALLFVARLPPVLAAGLVEATDGEVAEGPLAAFGTFDAETSGLAVGLQMAGRSDARAARAFWRQQRDALVTLAQGAALGPLVGRIRTRTAGAVVEVAVTVEAVDVARLATALNDDERPDRRESRRRRKRRKQH